MLAILGCVTVDHDLRLVVLAGLVCLFACFTALELMTRVRSAQGRARLLWIAGAGTVAGCGVWTTHFVAMLAYRSSVPISYDLALTSLSIVAAISLATAGITIVQRLSSGMPGGLIVGGAIGTMHYIGMAALRGPVEITWDASYVAASLIAGPMLSAAAFGVAKHSRSRKITALAAGLLTLGICALHFTAMTAVTLTPVALGDGVGGALEPTSLALAIAAIALLLIGLGFAGSIFDRHLGDRAIVEAERLRTYVAELETTKRDLEQTSLSLRQALAAASASIESKSQFLAAMSHELRTPLNAILGYSELMQQEPFGPLGNKRYLTYAGDIHASGSQLLAVISDILDMARLDAGRMELEESELDLAELVREAVRMVAQQAEEGEIRVEQDMPVSMPHVRADRRRVKQALLNLLSNAVKFTPAGGMVRVSMTYVADCVGVSIADTGIGMKAEDIPAALERFRQIDASLARKYEGTGLGLPLAKQLMELHDGGLRIESKPGVGTTVTIVFPSERTIPASDWSDRVVAAAR